MKAYGPGQFIRVADKWAREKQGGQDVIISPHKRLDFRDGH